MKTLGLLTFGVKVFMKTWGLRIWIGEFPAHKSHSLDS